MTLYSATTVVGFVENLSFLKANLVFLTNFTFLKNSKVKKYTIRLYTASDFGLWNDFIAQAKNTSFLFHRDFMEYHKDRFEDYSLMVFEKAKLLAVLPANKIADELHSHTGLTYGGIVIGKDLKLQVFLEMFKEICQFLKPNFNKIFFKVIPSIYNTHFSDELLYALFLNHANLIRRDTLSVIDTSLDISISQKRKYEIRKGVKHNLEIRQTDDLSVFWNHILIPTLQEKHCAKPVHSLDEIQRLKQFFPTHIKQYDVYFEGEIVAGTTVFETETVAHIQYIGSNELRGKLGSIDYLFDYLIKAYKPKKKYFDFGISNEQQGRVLNEGLTYWKESFGAKPLVQDFYELNLQSI
jgi:hypothetical protein